MTDWKRWIFWPGRRRRPLERPEVSPDPEPDGLFGPEGVRPLEACGEPHPKMKGVVCKHYGKCTPPFNHFGIAGQFPRRYWVKWPAKGNKDK